MWEEYNENPDGKDTGDCVIRALTTATGLDWNTIYWSLCLYGSYHHDWGNRNSAWWHYLQDEGWTRRLLHPECPTCYTIRDFCRDFPVGTYIVGTDGHVVAVINGTYIDSWNSGNESPIYYWTKEE